MRSIYFLLLAAVIDTELTLGILVAPVIFFPQSIIGEGVMSVGANKFASSLILISLANAAFCRLFGGDAGSVVCIFFATLVGYTLKFAR